MGKTTCVQCSHYWPLKLILLFYAVKSTVRLYKPKSKSFKYKRVYFVRVPSGVLGCWWRGATWSLNTKYITRNILKIVPVNADSFVSKRYSVVWQFWSEHESRILCENRDATCLLEWCCIKREVTGLQRPMIHDKTVWPWFMSGGCRTNAKVFVKRSKSKAGLKYWNVLVGYKRFFRVTRRGLGRSYLS